MAEIITRTEAQKRALEAYIVACTELAHASKDLHQAKIEYYEAMSRYERAHGVAHALGVA